MKSISRIALTAGEPAGIGPDLVIMLAQHTQQCQLIILADPVLLAQRAAQLKLPVKLIKIDLNDPARLSQKGEIYYLPFTTANSVEAGILDPNNALYVINTLQAAAAGCLNGAFNAVVTAPVHKGVINEASIPFSGHTEFFAEAAGVDKVVMMLATPELRVALATTHLPLSQVSAAINRPELLRVLQIINNALKLQFGLKQPRIAVCGLNPHAGEGGHLGREEIEEIEPALHDARKLGIEVSGPWPADTIFVKHRLQDYDVVLAMFHDQGLPVLKHQGFGGAVNITLGLPFIRTSVDHGTALDLAGSGQAQVTSLQAAVDMALSLVENATV